MLRPLAIVVRLGACVGLVAFVGGCGADPRRAHSRPATVPVDVVADSLNDVRPVHLVSDERARATVSVQYSEAIDRALLRHLPETDACTLIFGRRPPGRADELRIVVTDRAAVATAGAIVGRLRVRSPVSIAVKPRTRLRTQTAAILHIVRTDARTVRDGRYSAAYADVRSDGANFGPQCPVSAEITVGQPGTALNAWATREKRRFGNAVRLVPPLTFR